MGKKPTSSQLGDSPKLASSLQTSYNSAELTEMTAYAHLPMSLPTSLLPLVAKDFSNQVALGLHPALLAHRGKPGTHTFLLGWADLPSFTPEWPQLLLFHMSSGL